MIYTLRVANVSDHDRQQLVRFAAELPPDSELLAALRQIGAALLNGYDTTLVTATFAGTELL